jgi:hypothetical protein
MKRESEKEGFRPIIGFSPSCFFNQSKVKNPSEHRCCRGLKRESEKERRRERKRDEKGKRERRNREKKTEKKRKRHKDREK